LTVAAGDLKHEIPGFRQEIDVRHRKFKQKDVGFIFDINK